MKAAAITGLEKLIDSLETETELSNYISNPDNLWNYQTFPQYFRSLKKVSEIDAPALFRKSGIERTYCYHIMNGSKHPGRDKIIRLCIAASLTLSETQSALLSGDEAMLSGNIARDIVIAYAIENEYDLEMTSALLEKTKQAPLS